MKILVPVTLGIPKRKVDNSVILPMTTTLEVNGEDYLEMDKLRMTTGWMMFSPNEADVIDAEMPRENAPDKESKSSSKRLYNVLFVYWKQLGEPGDFDVWRKVQMEKFINQIKDKLED
mgnify:CR=1 FL=1